MPDDGAQLHDLGAGSLAVLARLDALTVEIRGLRADVATLAARPVGQGEEIPHAVAELLQAIAASVGTHSFATSDLLNRVPTSADAELRKVMIRACGATSPRRIGRLLRRHEGEVVAGLRIVRDGECDAGILWRLVSQFETGETPSQAVRPRR